MSSTIGSIGALEGSLTATSPTQRSFAADFANLLKDNMSETNTLLNKSDSIVRNFSTSKTADLHEVMIAVEEAGMALSYTMQVRNKIIEGYQELMRTQI